VKPRRYTTQRGFGLFDAMIAFSILAFGLLTMTRFQFRLIAQATEAQQRGVATQLADELLNTMLVDAGSATCYTLPAAGACANPAAMARAADWRARAMAILPGATGATSALDVATNRMVVTLNWVGKDSDEARSHVVISDVRGN
jgi:Tfp pilus assembly protein PilV